MTFPANTLYPGATLYPGNAGNSAGFMLIAAVQVAEDAIRVTWQGNPFDGAYVTVGLESFVSTPTGAQLTTDGYARKVLLSEDAPGSKSMVIRGLYAGFTWDVKLHGSYLNNQGFAVALTFARDVAEAWTVKTSGSLQASDGTTTWIVDLAKRAPAVSFYRDQHGGRGMRVQSAMFGPADLGAGAPQPTTVTYTYTSRLSRRLSGLVPGHTYKVLMLTPASVGLVDDYEIGVTNAKVRVPAKNGLTRFASGEQLFPNTAGSIPVVFVPTRASVELFIRTTKTFSGSWSAVNGHRMEDYLMFGNGTDGTYYQGIYTQIGSPIMVWAQSTYQINGEDAPLYAADINLNDVVMDGSVGDFLDLYVNSLDGYHYINRSNKLVIGYEPDVVDKPRAYFADHAGAGHIGYSEPKISYGEDGLVNDLTVTNHKNATKVLTTDPWAEEDVTIHRKNAASIAKYGPVAVSVDWALHDNGVNMDERIAKVLADGADEKWQITEIVVNAQAAPREMFNLEICDLVEVEYKGYIQLSRIDAIDMDGGADNWTITLTLYQEDFYPVSPTFRQWEQSYVTPDLTTFDDFTHSQGAETFGSFTDNPRRT